jgi:hypothetical protein
MILKYEQTKKEVSMKQFALYYFLAIISAIIASCSPKAYVEKDPNVNLGNYKTYAWVDTKSSRNENDGNVTEFAKLSLHNVVNEKLQRAGWKEVSEHPDVLLTYDVLVERKVEQRSNPVYTQPFTRFYYNPYFQRWAAIYYPSRFIGYDNYKVPVKEATITISMMDAKTDKKIWQGWTTEPVNSRLLATKEVSSSVNRIFKKFDVANSDNSYDVASK